MKQFLSQLRTKYPKGNKAYTLDRTQTYFILAICLVTVATGIGYGYFSTIGNLGIDYSKQLMIAYLIKIGMTFLGITIAECLAQAVKNKTVHIGKILKEVVKSPTIPYYSIFVLLLAFDISMSALVTGAIVIFLTSQFSKHGYSFYRIHPVATAYLITVIVEVRNYANLGFFTIPTLLNSPFTASVSELTNVSYDQFQSTYYSLDVVVFGFFQGGTSFMLFIFLGLSCLLLLKRKYVKFTHLLLYVFGYIAYMFAYGTSQNLEQWLIILGCLNGHIMFTATFLLSDVVILPKSALKSYVYVLLLTILTIYITLHVHFIIGPLLALFILQGSLTIYRLIASLFKKQDQLSIHLTNESQ